MKKLLQWITPGLLFAMAIFFSACGNSSSGDSSNEEPTIPPSLNAPYFTPGAGSFSKDIKINIETKNISALIYYTTDGTVPSEKSSLFSVPIPLSGNGSKMKIRCIAVFGGVASSETVGDFQIKYEKVSTPQFSVQAGTSASDLQIQLTCSTSDAMIYYTTNGDVPNETSSVFSSASPILVSGNGTQKTIKAIAVKNGYENSTVVSASYKIEYPAVVIPSFNPAPGSFSTDISVAITSENGAKIYFTTDGSVPTESSSLYNSPILVKGNKTTKTIRVLAVKSGCTSSSSSGDYAINYLKVSTPQFGLAAGTYTEDKTVTITSAISDAVIHYTTDGSDPDENSAVYSAPVTVSGDGTTLVLKAIAVKEGMENSTISQRSYTINYPLTTYPALSIVNGLVDKTDVLFITSESGAKIYYTTNGDVPIKSSILYTGGIPFSGFNDTVTIKAFAVMDKRKNSNMTMMTYKIIPGSVYLIGYANHPFQSKTYSYIIKNGLFSQLASTGDITRVSAMSINNGHIYISGAIDGQPAYWYDGVSNTLPSGNRYIGDTKDIFISNGNTYIAGYYITTGTYTSLKIACYWKNGTKIDLDTTDSEAYSIYVYGTNVYVVGQAYNGSNYSACIWKNGVRTFLDASVSSANKIIGNGTDIYVSGSFTSNGNPSSCFWKNGTRNNLNTLYNSNTMDIALFGSDVYVSGYYTVSRSPFPDDIIGCIWKNSVESPLVTWYGRYDAINTFKFIDTNPIMLRSYMFEGESNYFIEYGGQTSSISSDGTHEITDMVFVP